MMFEIGEAVDGIQYAVQEIDDEIRTFIPELKRRKCTPRVMQEVDALLDIRNDLTATLGDIAINEMERMIE